MGVRLRSRDQTAKCGMAHEKFSSEESTHEQIWGGNHDYCFFDSHGIVHKAFVLYLQDSQLITPSTKMSWNDLENGSSGVHSEWTLQTTGCCTTITRQLALHFQFENFWRRKTFQYFHILKRDTLHTERGTCALPLYRCRCSEQVKTCLRITSWIVRWLCGGHR